MHGSSFFYSRDLEHLRGSFYLLSFNGQHLSHLLPFPPRCLTSCDLEFSRDLDPIVSSRNWFHFPVDLTVKFFSTLSNTPCSNLNPLFLFLSLLTNESGFFSIGKLPRYM